MATAPNISSERQRWTDNNHNARVLAQKFPNIGANKIAELAAKLGVLQTKELDLED